MSDLQFDKTNATYAVKYDANGGSGAPASQTKTEGKTLTLSGTKPTKSFKLTYDANGGSVSPASKTVNATFSGWNTRADGSGTKYSPGGAYKADANATLYAQWTNPKAGTLATPTRSNYTFDGWYTAASGGSKVTDASTVSADITLYAHWTPIPNKTYTVKYDANGGSGAPAAQTKTEGKTLTLSSVKPARSFKITYNANGGSVTASSKTVNATFTGWNTKSDGSGTKYYPGGEYKADANATLYAQWTNPKAGALTAPTRSGYTFDGWYTAASGGSKVTDASTVSANITLYAHWTPVPGKSPFQWGTDNWSFTNTSANYPSGTYRNQISSKYLEILSGNLNPSEWQQIFYSTYGYKAFLDRQWEGSCYGMSVVTLLAKKGILPFQQYQSGATRLFDLNRPSRNPEVSSLITYYHMLQLKDDIQQQVRKTPQQSHKNNIKQLISLLDKNDTVLVCFKQENWGGHAILAYDYEYGDFYKNNVRYQGRIKICDPNSADSNNQDYYIYFKTDSYEWEIPYYKKNDRVSSAYGAVFAYIGASLNEVNAGGLLSSSSVRNASGGFAPINAAADEIEGDGRLTDMAARNASGYIARIELADNLIQRSVTKLKKDDSNHFSSSFAAPGDIIPDYSCIIGNASEITGGYNLLDGEVAYKISQDNPVELQATMDYENCFLTGGSASGNFVIFDKSGYVEVSGESAEYTISMTFNEDYPTDWFTVQVKGEWADKASLQKTAEGYVISADNLTNTEVKANNRTNSASARFSTEYPSALIYEVDTTTIGVKVDTDDNGTYETVLKVVSAISIPGDVDGNGTIEASDARLALRASVKLESFAKGSAQFLAADVDGNGTIEASDARLILRASVKLEDLSRVSKQ